MEVQAQPGKEAFSDFLKPKTTETLPLSTFYETPPLLVPPRLLELVRNPGHISVVQLPYVFIGSLDDGYCPSLSCAIIEKESFDSPRLVQEADDYTKSGDYNWARTLNHHRRKALEIGLLSPFDQVLILLLAHNLYPDGVKIESYVQAQHLQGRRPSLGRSFFAYFEDSLHRLGYNYWWGNHNQYNIDFFLRIGNHPIGSLREEALREYRLAIPPFQRTQYTTIKFLDESLKELCVKEDLKKV